MRRAAPLGFLLCALCCLPAQLAWGADRVRVIVAGSERSTNVQIIRDIATQIARPADIEFDVHTSIGSPDTLLRLREGHGLQFALLQADVATAYLGAAAHGYAEANQLFDPVRVLAPIHEEDIYFIVRADSPLNFVHEIAAARINMGPQHSGSALTAATLYRLLFDTAIPAAQTSFHTHQDALAKLIKGSIDVVTVVAPPPARLLADMKPDARRFIKLLRFDPQHASAAAILKVYTAKPIPASRYPNLLSEDLPALSVGIYLVSHGSDEAQETRFARSWCQNLPRLRDEAHAALRDLKLELPTLATGWTYAKPFERELRACIEASRVPPKPCTPENRALGLCS